MLQRDKQVPVPMVDNKINILMVDDYPDTLLAFEAVLAAPHLNLVKAYSGNDALRALLKMDFALILLDVSLPDTTGFELTRLIRQRDRNRHVPIILVTGHNTDPESMVEGYLSGAVDYLLKPVDSEILRAKTSFFIDLYMRNQSLWQSGQVYQQFAETGKLIVWRANPATMQFTHVSKEAEGTLGYPTEKWVTSSTFLMDRLHPDDRNAILSKLHRAAQDKAAVEMEFRMIAADGRQVWFQNMVRIAEQGNGTAALIGIMLDITDRKHSEEAIRLVNEQLEKRVQERTAELEKMLREKESLLREIHHRVKNNLQIISSLLNLQKKYVKNQDGWDILNESQNRVLSMALIHEKLYETTNLAEIGFASYITELTTHLLQSYGVEFGRVRMNVQSNVTLNIDTAIPCGLIVNELVSNSLKYAFPDSRKGNIIVCLTKDDSLYLLTVNDDGVGLPSNFDPAKSESLGMRLVRTLAAQLHGTVEMNGTGGAAIRIQFPQRSAK